MQEIPITECKYFVFTPYGHFLLNCFSSVKSEMQRSQFFSSTVYLYERKSGIFPKPG